MEINFPVKFVFFFSITDLLHGGVEIIFLYFIGSELDQGPEQPVVEAERNNSLDNVGPRDSDLTDCEYLYANNKRSRKRKTEPENGKKM